MTHAEPHESDATRGQVNTDAARVYDEFFVPALFEQWPAHLLDVGSVDVGHRVLDVGCGTGVLAGESLGRVAPSGGVVGVDVNDGMLALAAAKLPSIEWVTAPAERLPFEDGSFDRVLSQFAMMFFEDRRAAVGEMRRIVRPGGQVVVATWASLEATPGYAAMVDLVDRVVGSAAADALTAPFVLGDEAVLGELLSTNFGDVEVEVRDGVARFASIDAWVHTDVRGWTLSDLIDDELYAELLDTAGRELARFERPDGTIEFDAPAILARGVAA